MDYTTIIVAIIGSGALNTLLAYLLSLRDKRKGIHRRERNIHSIQERIDRKGLHDRRSCWQRRLCFSAKSQIKNQRTNQSIKDYQEAKEPKQCSNVLRGRNIKEANSS